MNHDLTVIAGQSLRILVTLKDAEGAPLPADHAAIRGSVSDYLGTRHPMAAENFDARTVLLSVPPLPAGRYRYDIFARRSDGIAPRLAGGELSVCERITAPSGEEHAAGERIVATINSEQTLIAVTVEEITAVAEADWQQIQQAADRAEQAADRAEATLPALEQEIAAARTTIEQEADQAARQAAAETAGLIATTGETASAAVREEAVRATSSALEAISTAEATAITQATNNGINAIGQSITAGTTAIETAVTAGTGTINQTVTGGMALLDGYVGTVSDDLARYSRGGQWGGVQTFNAPVVFNGGGIVSTGTPLAYDPFSDTQRITGLLDSQYLQAMYGGRSLPLTFETHATDAYYDGSRRGGYAFMFGRTSEIGAWRSAWLTSQQVISGNMWIHVPTSTGSTRRQTARTGVYAINILPAASNTDSAASPPPVVVGLNSFFTGHAAADSLPSIKRPWDPQVLDQPHHANWNQPKAVVCCEAYGHLIATLHVCVGYGGSVTSKDVTPAAILYNCIPSIRYKSPISDVSAITAFYVTADSNGQGYHNGTTRTYIQTGNGQLVSVIGTPLDQRFNSMGVVTRSKAGSQASACIRDIVHYPNIRPSGYYANNVPYYNPVHPIETWLEGNTTLKLTRPTQPLNKKISIAYTPSAPAEYPYDLYNANISGGVMDAQPYGYYGSSLYISRQAQDMVITCPDGWIIDVDIWSQEWCVKEGNTLHILPNDTGAARFVSVWIYSPDNTNTADGTNTVWEYAIHQSAQ